MHVGSLAKQKVLGGGQPGSGVYGRRVRPRVCQVRTSPLTYPGHHLSASMIPQDPPPVGLPLAPATLPLPRLPAFPSPASSAPPEVTRNWRAATRQKGSAGPGERVPARLTAPACGRERSKRLPEAAKLRFFPGLSLSKGPARDS